MKGISFWFLFLASLFALAGMAWGIQMSSSGDHLLAPAHAHNNLIGWVTLAIYGLYYAAVPAAAEGALAKIHFWLAFLGALLLGIGIAMAVSGQGEVIAIVASILTILGMLTFAVQVWRNRIA